jgi:two-component system response regulator PilR (NtrC family)
MPKSILIVEDETILRESLAELMAGEGFEVLQAADGKVAREIILQRPVDVVVTDVRMPGMDGLTLLGHLHQIAPQTPVIVATAFGTVETAVTAMRSGAFDYLLKPVQFDDMILKVQRAIEYGQMARTQEVITEQLAEKSTFHNLVGNSAAVTKLFEMVKKLSQVKSNVIIVGESGTGKELFARAVHYNGITRGHPFVPVNCGALTDTLIESELFGYRRGAFTGANRDKIGYFEAANGGTIFLDEISTLPYAVQSSLLRAIEDRAVVPVGDTHARPIDVRIIAASNQNLEEMVQQKLFREDLLFRLNVVQFQLPPLRQRKEDIPLLVHHFLAKYTKEMNKKPVGMTNGAMRAMLSHQWRGNVRELENVIERAVIFAEGKDIGVEDLPFAVAGLADDVGEDLKAAMEHFERQHILASLARHNGDKAETARALGIGVSSLCRKLDELKINKSEPDPAAP